MSGRSSLERWPDGHNGSTVFMLAPPTPVKPRRNVALAWEEGVEMHGTAFVVLHGRTCYSAEELRRYAAAVLAAAEVLKKGERHAEVSERG